MRFINETYQLSFQHLDHDIKFCVLFVATSPKRVAKCPLMCRITFSYNYFYRKFHREDCIKILRWNDILKKVYLWYFLIFYLKNKANDLMRDKTGNGEIGLKLLTRRYSRSLSSKSCEPISPFLP